MNLSESFNLIDEYKSMLFVKTLIRLFLTEWQDHVLPE